MKAYVNDKIIDSDKAKISIFDRGFLYGDGLFETMRSYDGKVFRLNRHLDRLYSSMKSFKIRQRFSGKEMERVVYKLLDANSFKNAYIRITVTRGISCGGGLDISKNEIANVVITAKEYAPRPAKYYEEGIKAGMARLRKNSQSFSSNFKVLNYLDNIIARNEAIPGGFVETVFLNEFGYICEGSVSNIFMVCGDKVMTPSIDCGVLPGITREAVLELAPYAGMATQEGRFKEEELKSSDEVFITNSLIEVMPVVKIAGREIGNGDVGPVTRKIQELYKELERGSGL
ncbi:MAG: aminotransferase class IV [Candidatus Omnitrophota bacterium]|nr:aminotransferase class IV [Candidatus Omnitrophota bacterium]